MRPHGLLPLILRHRRPSFLLGIVVAAAGIAAETAVVYPLKHVAPVVSLGVVYLLAVVVVSVFWGFLFGVLTAVVSVGAFSFFHLPPVGRLTLADSGNWIGLAAFVVVAAVTALMAQLARSGAEEADQRRREADLAAELAQLLLGASRLEDGLPRAGELLAAAIGVERARIVLEPTRPPDGQMLVLQHEGHAIGALELDPPLADVELAWVRGRVVPALESILAAALNRAALAAEVVETAALRRSDEMKTAVLRSVSHDLRTPVTTILTAAATLEPDAGHVSEVRELVIAAATRLSTLIEKLLDLSLLQAGRSEPHLSWYSLDELLHEAMEHAGAGECFRVSIDPDLPLLQGDPAQLERALANVLENAVRYSNGKPVAVRAREVSGRIRVRIVDEGPGIDASQHERVFTPFFRAEPGNGVHHGSGLGLAIAKGFVEAGGGRISVESAPGQGASFVIEFPLPGDREPAAAGAAARPG